MEVIGIDIGRTNVKIVSAEREIMFPSWVGGYRTRKISKGGEYSVSINGVDNFVGQLAIDEGAYPTNIFTEGKINKETKILFLAAVALSCKNGGEICISTGLPIDQNDMETMNKLIELLQGEYVVKINDGKEKKFSINKDNIMIAPEGGGAYWDAVLDNDLNVRSQSLTKGIVRTIDIGSRTINYCTTKNNEFIDRDSGTLTEGMAELTANKEDPTYEDKEGFVRAKIGGKLAKKWQDFRTDDIVLLAGGGGKGLEKWLRDLYPMAKLADDPIMSNARGFYKMGMMQWLGK